MSLEPYATTRSLFRTSTRLPGKPARSVLPHAHLRDPVFVSPRNFFRFSWLELLGSLFPHDRPESTNVALDLFRKIPLLDRRIVVTPLTISLAIHLLAIPLLPFFLRVVPRAAAGGGRTQLPQHDIVYYRFTKLDKPIPRVSPKGPAGHPGSNMAVDRVPRAGASKSLGPLFAISRPRVPDNDHQTILQSKSPGDLKIKADVPLPNLIIVGPAAPKRPLEFNGNQVRPRQPSGRSLPSDSSALTEIAAAPATNGMLGVSVPQPHLPVPLGGTSAPVHAAAVKSYGSLGDGPAIEAEPVGHGGDSSASLLVLGLSPPGSAQNVALPPGNRYGEFSVSPSGAGSGSPGDSGNGQAGGEKGAGNGAGTDASTRVGNGNYGGGGGNNSDGFVLVHGFGSESSILADPGPAAVQLVYALPASMLLRHNKLVVSAGPIGGGGSAAYGVLPCGKIYTVFLATAQKQWSLQYCQKSQTPESSANRARSTVVHTELPILAPEAETRFDFKRVPLPPEKASKSILIRGVLTEEGKPENLEVLQGLLPIMDSAALSAFKQWTFKPAMRSGKPMRVEILLSIPMN